MRFWIGSETFAAVSLAALLAGGCSEGGGDARPAKAFTPEMKEIKADLSDVDDDIERVEASLDLASDSARKKLEDELAALKEKRHELKRRMKQLKGKGREGTAAPTDPAPTTEETTDDG